MGTAGTFLQIAAWAGGILGVLASVFDILSGRPVVFGIPLIAASVIGWAFFYGVGAALIALEEIHASVLRSVVANERTANAVEALAGISHVTPLETATSFIDEIETTPPRNTGGGTVLRRLDERRK